ncbi:uncharacterized protein LOC136088971 isoform X2 [Hydra vulgaris]
MRNGYIKANQLTASSMYNNDYSPNLGRLNNKQCWCADNKGLSEWYQVQFEKVTTVNGIALQGCGKEYIKKFFFSYSLTKYDNFVDGQIFDGVSNENEVVYRWFLNPINALRIKIFPRVLGYSYACLRIELFGCLSNPLEEIGMESQIILDSQISISANSSVVKSQARMYYGSGNFWSSHNIDLYIQIDMKHVMSISGIAIKGSDVYSSNVVQSYLVFLGTKYNLDFVGEYPGNFKLGYSPVLSTLNTTKVGSQIKIVRKTTSINLIEFSCMAVEIYGKPLNCGDVIPIFAEMSSTVNFTIMDAYIDSPYTWCALSNDSKPYTMIELNQVSPISGINVQGDSNSDSWVIKYQISYGVDKYKMNDDKNFYNGPKGRIFPYTINWFPRLYFAKYLKVMPASWNNNCCMRIHVRGCTKFLNAPTELNINEENKKLMLSWKKPDSKVSILKYNVSLHSFKPYNSSFSFLMSVETVNTNITIKVGFHAAIFNISVDAVYDENYFVRESLSYYSKPISPPTPTHKVLKYFDNYTEIIECQFYSVSDINGPVSFYEIIIAYENISSMNMETLTLKDQSSAESLNLSYFLAAKLPNNFTFSSLKFYEGKERVDSLNAKLSTIRNLFLYIRAVINMKVNFFSNLTYNGNVLMLTIDRKTLPLNNLKWNKNHEHIIELVKGPLNTKIYEVVAMKINKSTIIKNATSTYKHFKVYETAGYNEPYIAASFNASMYENYKYFILGNNEYFSVDKFEGYQVSNDQNNTNRYLNGKLIAGQTYSLFQRILLDDGRIYTSPWHPEFVAFSMFTPSIKKSSTHSYLFGLIVIPVLILSLIAFLKMRNKFKKDNLMQSKVIHNKNNEDAMQYQELCLKYNNPYSTLQTVQKWPPLSVNEFAAYYLNVKKNGYKDLVTQYESVSKDKIYPHNEATKHPHKNRYANIVPYDYSLVKLVPSFTNYENTYINANYIPSYSKKVTYIATQAPKNETVVDFWQMIFQEKPKAVIMLTNLVENDKIKSAQYWPESNEGYGGLNVCVTKTENFADFIIRYISLNFQKVNHHFIHMQFTSWSENGFPEYPAMLLNFCHRFRCLVPYSDKSLTVVHCSGGVGRTGVFILLDEMLQLIKSEQKVDIFNYFETIRQNRMQMVQSKEQYIFVYDAIYEAVTCGQTSISMSNFPTIVNNLLKKDFSSGKKLIEDEFKMLQSFSLFQGSNEIAMKDKNFQKNKYPQIILGENVLVAGEPYPYAVFVDSFKRKKAFIATQCPLQSTVTEFWYILKKHNISTILYLTSRNEKNEESYYKFYPSDSDLKLNGVTVKLLAEEKLEFVIKRNLSVSVESETIMCMLEFSFWSDNCLPSFDLILKLITEVSKSQQYFGNGIVAVVCNNVLSRSGIFISCFNAIEQLQIEGQVDIFQVVRRAHLSHPSFVQTLPQYEFVYKFVKHYLETFSDYSNFT